MALVIRVWNHTAAPVLQPREKVTRGGGLGDNACFSPGAYLLITAITTATLVCLFAGMVH